METGSELNIKVHIVKLEEGREGLVKSKLKEKRLEMGVRRC